MTTTEPLLPPRIQACLDAGCQEKLFPLLATWSAEELQAADDELDQAYRRTRDWVKERYDQLTSGPDCLMGDERAALDLRLKEVMAGLVEMCGEIQDVIDHHLRRLGHKEGAN